MREILFKAKRIDNGEWVEGYITQRKYYGTEEVIESHIVLDVYEQITNGQRYLRSDLGYNSFRVDPDTICQYTGLTDKNGNKIWENDVVCTPYVDPIFGDMVNNKILDDYTWKVVFIDGGLCVENECKRINLRSFTNGNNIKVAGNIFDNPELLKED